jgi:hypothetical protein
MLASALTARSAAVCCLLSLSAGAAAAEGQPAASSPAPRPYDLEAAKLAAAARSADQVSVEWDGIKLNKPDIIKRLGRLLRNARWERVEKLSIAAVENGDPELLAMGHFYLAVARARDIPSGKVTAEEVIAMVREAADLGFRNPLEIKSSQPLQPLLDFPDMKKLLAGLEEEFEQKYKKKVRDAIDQELELSRKTAGASWRPALKSIDGQPFWLENKACIAVVTRIHHDGFDKLLPLLQDLHRKRGDAVGIGVIFYQYDSEDSARAAQTQEYVRKRGIGFPCAVIGHGQFKELVGLLEKRHAEIEAARKRKNNPFTAFQPLSIFLDGQGVPLYVSRGAVPDWQLEHAADKLAAVGRD